MDKQYTIDDLIKIVEVLRGDNGCPWDKVQTHQSIKKNMIEEAYEAIDALDNGSDDMFANELGDVLLQVVFHAQLAKERDAFDFNTVLNEICNKLISRHTHVFGDDKAKNADEALESWERNKKKEKNLKSDTEVLCDVPGYLPALMRAEKVIKKSEGLGCKYEREDICKKISDCLKKIIGGQKSDLLFGELLFNITALSRIDGITAETALPAYIEKFIKDFSSR